MASKKTVISKITDTEEACGIIQEWFQRENRPVTAQSLTDALGSRIRKPLVQKTLEALLERQVLQCKDLKKVRFFFLNVPNPQTATAEMADVPAPPEPALAGPEEDDLAEVETVGGAADALVDKVMSLRALNEARATELAQLAAVPTMDERRLKLDALTREVEALCASLARIQSARSQGSGQGVPAVADVHALVSHHHTARGLWKERKEFTLRLIEAVMGDVCTLAELSELFGITTDEEAGVSFRHSALAIPRVPSCTMPAI